MITFFFMGNKFCVKSFDSKKIVFNKINCLINQFIYSSLIRDHGSIFVQIQQCFKFPII